ncbi:MULTISPECIES: hypothetical protein [unclassified Mesorhizobium]|uniref:hypothetical protein n=1 Tax=unclassified Mesorhizobium TaxID=325217 RepID=UPI000FCA72B6|nr:MULTISPECIES: hypothetical protein [unclassified Mesorhizobium]RUV92917.1 hypothetical protein EOA49_30655 [Mesorhizobium sp. M1A.F.Ca.IN.020.04.1.1]RUW06401.1 hypothetical protein EOA53_23500 [Mesorhizobium sp. M1A.F.Ca.IN.020.03.1.1]RWH25980.1 MAG: hypothetical protein EOQ76_18825 [Mesorhizobium sp.]RWH40232.1 MAG: hypothetical protein EOQ79_04295 [Mesorhizobium sp.]TIR60101.1 MAG: hypothetical protein E5X22_11270 [Mesorhizobium sp.]
MTRHAIANDLEGAADQIAEMSRADLQVMLRRAALMLRNVTGLVLEPKVEDSLSGVAEEMGVSKADLVRTIVSDWLMANAYLPVPYALDEESSVEGST